MPKVIANSPRRFGSASRRRLAEISSSARISSAIRDARRKFISGQSVELPNGKKATVDYQDQNGVYLKEYPGSIFEPSRLSKA